MHEILEWSGCVDIYCALGIHLKRIWYFCISVSLLVVILLKKINNSIIFPFLNEISFWMFIVGLEVLFINVGSNGDSDWQYSCYLIWLDFFGGLPSETSGWFGVKESEIWFSCIGIGECIVLSRTLNVVKNMLSH